MLGKPLPRVLLSTYNCSELNHLAHMARHADPDSVEKHF